MKPIAGSILRAVARTATLAALLGALAVPDSRNLRGGIEISSMKAVSCDIPSGLVFVRADAPSRLAGGGEPRVTFTGYVETPRDYCGDEVRILGQRKVCGAFGCSYHTIERSPYVEFDRVAELKLFHDCHRGTHRYRTIVEYTAPNVRNPQNRFFVQDREESEQITC